MAYLSFNLAETLGLSIVVLMVGRLLVHKIAFLNKFCIPQPVVGGLLFALVTLLGQATNTFSITMDTTLQTFFMLCFFTTVGFGASLGVLKKGGIGVVVFLAIASLLCAMQNVVGAGVAALFGQSPLLGIAAGSAPMTGGHGTAAAFGPMLEEAGLPGATTIAVAAATFGLISGSLLGGPTARRLIVKNNLFAAARVETGRLVGRAMAKRRTSAETGRLADRAMAKRRTSQAEDNQHNLPNVLDEDAVTLDSRHLCDAFFQISIAVGIGSLLSDWIDRTGITVSVYIGAMLVAACMRNVFTEKTVWETRTAEIQALGEVFLSIFLSQALMNLRLWELAYLALPLIAILVSQTLLMYLFATRITYACMGKDYDAAVLAAGHCGFGLGATPNAIANMSAVTERFGPSAKAFFILPIVGSLFIDFVNSGIIVAFINFLR